MKPTRIDYMKAYHELSDVFNEVALAYRELRDVVKEAIVALEDTDVGEAHKILVEALDEQETSIPRPTV